MLTFPSFADGEVTLPVLGGPVTAEGKLVTLGLEAKGGSNSKCCSYGGSGSV